MTQLSFEFRQRCEKIATDARYELGLYAFAPLPSEKIVSHYGGYFLFPEHLEDMDSNKLSEIRRHSGWSAVLLMKQPPIVLCNPAHSNARHESNVMHEMAHVLLNHPWQQIHWHNDQWSRDYDSRIETEAAYLGGCLQIPRRAVLWAVQHGMTKDDMVDYYGASAAMVQWRINASGVSDST